MPQRSRVVRGAYFALSFLLCLLVLTPSLARAQDSAPPAGDALDGNSYPVLTADQRAQISLGGFRLYLERVRPLDESLYDALDPPLSGLEGRRTAANVVVGVASVIAIGLAVASIPIFEGDGSDDAGVGLLVAAGGTFLVGLIISALLRPNQTDLFRLIDEHDRLLGRR